MPDATTLLADIEALLDDVKAAAPAAEAAQGRSHPIRPTVFDIDVVSELHGQMLLDLPTSMPV